MSYGRPAAESSAQDAGGLQNNDPEVEDAVQTLVGYCEIEMEALGNKRRDAAQALRGKSPSEILALLEAGDGNALVHHNAKLQTEILRDSAVGFTANCRMISGPLVTTRLRQKRVHALRGVKKEVEKEKLRLSQLARLRRDQATAENNAERQQQREEQLRQKEAAKRARQQAAARKKRAAARKKRAAAKKKRLAAQAKAARARLAALKNSSDILAMADGGEWQGGAAEEDDEEEEEEEEEAEAEAEECAEEADEAASGGSMDWAEAEDEFYHQIEELVKRAPEYDEGLRRVTEAASEGERAFVADVASCAQAFAVSGPSYAKTTVPAGVTVLKEAVLPAEGVAPHLRPERVAFMRQSSAGGSRAPLCTTTGAAHGTALHRSIQSIATALPSGMRTGIPQGLDPCVVPVVNGLRARKLVPIAAEVRVVDVMRGTGTRIDLVCVSADPAAHGAVVLVEMKTGSGGCFDQVIEGDPVVELTRVPGGDGDDLVHREHWTPLFEAQLQTWLTMAMLQASRNAHGIRGMVMLVEDRLSPAKCYSLPAYMYDGSATHAVYKRALQAHHSPSGAARLGLIIDASQA